MNGGNGECGDELGTGSEIANDGRNPSVFGRLALKFKIKVMQVVWSSADKKINQDVFSALKVLESVSNIEGKNMLQ